MKRLQGLLLASFALCFPLAGSSAQDYPSRSIRLIVPFPPAGATDIAARLVAGHLTKLWSQTVIVENRTGASGVIGTETAARSAPDGYTILMGTFATNVMAHLLQANVPYSRDSFAPVTLLTSTPNILLANSAVPAQTLKDLVTYVRANPGKVRYSSGGIGLTGHLGIALFAQDAGLDMIHVPYRGSEPMSKAFASGEVELALALVPPALAVIRNTPGTRALAIASDERSPKFPETPTFAELGYPNVKVYTINGLMVPAGTPAAVIGKIHQGAVEALRSPEISAKLDQLGLDVVASTPEQFGKVLAEEYVRWEPLVRINNIRAQ
jgi:tripartite-type tricarboxylate transporter receptor subunit TctC